MQRILETFTILLFVWIIQKLYSFFVALFVPKAVQNGTAMQLLKSGIRYITGFIGILFILSAWGVDSVTILASVGLIGVIVSFGAQSIIEDIIAGFFLIIEKQFSVGELNRFKVSRLLNKEFKLFCDRHNIDIPFPQVTINYKGEAPKK